MSEPCGKCDLFGCDHATASAARPPSDTGTTGWHRHDGDDAVWVGSECIHVGVITGVHERPRPVIVVDPAEARETIAAPIALARCQDVHANDTGNACRACQSFAQVVALRVLAALGSDAHTEQKGAGQ